MLVLNSLQDPKLVELLQKGSVGVIPTDTVYGLCAVASNKAAVERMYALKNREQKPGTLIAATIEQLVALGVDEQRARSVARLWPNAVSVIIPAPERLAYLHQELASLAVRIPKEEALHQLLVVTGVLVTTSANRPGEPPANNLDEAKAYFGDTVDFYVDGGDFSGHAPSTLVRLTDNGMVVLRQGGVVIPDSESS
ncbi:MAG TPA: L-threonylcarbamoyladenylate synthase [Candidatus Saccharimonadales bacterium]|nr:L-threonylcarbamoyladenylate synthase [Candidatus Saccharimonadales bacterium]